MIEIRQGELTAFNLVNSAIAVAKAIRNKI